MGVKTRADECLDELNEGLTQAINALDEIVVQQCWGHDEFKPDFQAKLVGAFNNLIILRRDLQ